MAAKRTTAAGASAGLAQDVRGFVSGGLIADVNQQRFPSAAGGILLDLGQPWVSAGAQGETFWQWPYFAGCGTVFGQVNLIPGSRIRPYVLAGAGFGESTGRCWVEASSCVHVTDVRASE